MPIPYNPNSTHPGKILREESLTPLGLSVDDVAKAIHLPNQVLCNLIDTQGSMTPSMALRQAKLFGMSANFCNNLQLRLDLYHVQQDEFSDIDAAKPFARAA